MSSSSNQENINKPEGQSILNVVLVFLIKMITWILKGVSRCTPHKVTSRLLSTFHQPDLKAIAKELENFPGGSIDLTKDNETGIAVMVINNPDKRNSLSGKMMVEMSEKVDQLEQWAQGKGLILMGKDGSFCSGGDLAFVKKALHYGAEMAAFQHHTLTRLHNLPLISVALLQGHTLGGGAELSTACDFRVMSTSGKIGFVQVKMGITTGWGATTRLVSLLGRKKALQFLSSAKIMSAQEAHQEGLVDHILQNSLSHNEELEACKQWLGLNYCNYDSNLLQAVKALIVHCDSSKDTSKSLKYERDVFAQFWGGPAQKAALAAKIKHN
ncbi:ethylmalonyl-CoA decarboxylase-like isoform X1 [Biomphalaria glabrata]|uniref:Ethylmalonyl-CoA decarboxylase n=2 Tax=Biomphalaria glabrata TaxID=6526 RepID=A0A9W3AGZ3_BIOGL|nr:ethylmalonyl-CoA decarboxylase-like isoform X1 [Biomphalaria glabrata]XP_055886497.1 ethylmalonyl-CoA decarboxylase-like isoform X1 [Biomphalaria glabrata]XP_055886498.1 ethylmalonyl-CoA decarboxylase-like isoform X1 [Biomphalaria glabrata]XP_055886499.1 ethylmalonyl-CoA decarboxylase-like isoform X1 [Biomphalaria glabrata]XP_055886500.1 ethylmalonyl-CoA decarboxylase-like isoform X1 [Biomphalaria glabrata]XP_055886501.1 ethylmalonyl-CoA decarboxylase-like isoform X1 [Biomphalaria glabrata]